MEPVGCPECGEKKGEQEEEEEEGTMMTTGIGEWKGGEGPFQRKKGRKEIFFPRDKGEREGGGADSE